MKHLTGIHCRFGELKIKITRKKCDFRRQIPTLAEKHELPVENHVSGRLFWIFKMYNEYSLNHFL